MRRIQPARLIARSLAFSLVLSGCNHEPPPKPVAEQHEPPPASPAVSAPAEAPKSRPAQIIEHIAPPPSRPASAPEKHEPIAAPVAPAVPPSMPLQHAQTGQFAEYRDLKGRTIRYEIEQTDADTVTTRISVMDETHHPLGQPASKEERRDHDSLAAQAERRKAKRTAHPDRIQAAGHEWDCTLYEDRWREEDIDYVQRTWMSPQAPALGVVRAEVSGDGKLESKLELMRYGSTPASKPN